MFHGSWLVMVVGRASNKTCVYFGDLDQSIAASG